MHLGPGSPGFFTTRSSEVTSKGVHPIVLITNTAHGLGMALESQLACCQCITSLRWVRPRHRHDECFWLATSAEPALASQCCAASFRFHRSLHQAAKGVCHVFLTNRTVGFDPSAH